MAGEDIRKQAEEMIGEIIADRYRLDAVLGLGGTGVVYQATSLEDDSACALKTIRNDLAHERAIARFFRGARLASGLDHPGLVQTIAFGKSKGQNGTPFQVMPLVEGPSWGEVDRTKLSPAQVLWMGCQVLDALAYVHARGVLHRDIKPANILLERQPDDTLLPRITDFGIAAAFLGDVGDMQITGGNLLVGTPAYMAPEQAQAGAMNGPQLDLYAVGVVLYQLLSGTLPFRGAAMEMLAAKATVDPPPLEVEGLDPLIQEAIGKLIARDPHNRYALAAQARRALEAHADPLVVPADQMQDLLRKQPQARVVHRPVVHWTPPGAVTIERAWPTLVLAEAAPRASAELVGREGVLRALEASARDAERGNVRLVSVVGEAGMGKTAVLEQAASELVEEGRFLVLRAPYFDGGAQRGGVRRGIERMLGVHGMDRAEVMVAVQSLLSRYDDVWPEEPEQLVDCLRPQDGIAPEEHAAHLGEQMALVARLLRRLSQTRPMLLLIDDADKASADLGRFIEFLVMEARFDRWPMMILCGVGSSTADSPFWEVVQRSETLDGLAHKQIRLHPIPDEALSQDLVRRHGLTQAEARRIVRRAGGNPLHARYLAEVMVSEDTSLDAAEDPTLSSATYALPSALLDLMQLRLDRHLAAADEPEEARAMLEAIAVLGEAVEEDLVRKLLVEEHQVNFERTLDVLLSLGVVGIVDHSEPLVLSFTPALLREAVLSRAGSEKKKALHLGAVDACLALEHNRRRSHWGAMGDHHAAAGDLKEARRCWLKGLRYEVSTGNVMRGVAWGKQALEAMESEDPDWAYTALLVASMCFDAGETAEAESLLRAVLSEGDVDYSLQAGDVLCDLFENRGDLNEWREVIEGMNAREAEAGPAGRCALYCARSMWHGHLGEPMEALADAQRALDLALPGPPAQRAAQRLAFANLPQMQLDAALKAAQRSLREAAEIPLLRVRSLRILGLVQVWQGKESAVETLTSAAQLCRQAGMLTRYPIALHDLGDAYRMSGRYQEARANYVETMQLCEGLPLTSMVVLCRFKLAICDIAEGRPRAMLPGLDALIAQGLEVGLGRSRHFGALLRAWAQAVCQDVVLTLEALEQAGPLEALQIDPQVSEIVIDLSERLVACVLSSQDGLKHLTRVAAVCNEARDLFGAAGDMARLQRAETLLRRLPSVPV